MPPFQANAAPTSPIPGAPTSVGNRKKVVVLLVLFGLLVVLIAAGAFAVHKGYGAHWYGSLKSFFGKRTVEKSVVGFIKEDYMQSVVMVRCFGPDGAEDGSHGSGVYFVGEGGVPKVETNAHVVLGEDGKFHGCNIYFPRIPDGSFYSSAYFAPKGDVFSDKESVIDGQEIEGLDYAILEITEPHMTPQGVPYPFPPVQRGVYDTQLEACKDMRALDLTDRVLMLGYPQIGEDSITITDGIVSGFTQDKIKVSAVTNHGVSGGIVISPETGCMLGIPTWVAGTADGGSLGYIISEGYKQAFLTGLTGKGTYGTKKSSEQMVPYTAPSGTVFVRPEFWTSEPIPQESLIINEHSRIGLLPGFTMEVLDDGKSVRVTNPGGVKFNAPPEDIFDQSFANFRFLEGVLPGGSVQGAFDAVAQGINFLYGGNQELTKKPAFSKTKDGYPLASFSYRVSYTSGTVVYFNHLMIFAHGRLYQFIASVTLDPSAQKGFEKDYKPVLDKLVEVADSIEIR